MTLASVPKMLVQAYKPADAEPPGVPQNRPCDYRRWPRPTQLRKRRAASPLLDTTAGGMKNV
jgi:hypothetical protein